MSNIIGGTLVLSSAEEVTTTQACRSIIGFRTLLPNSTKSGDNEDSTYPFSNCLDYRDNTQYSPAASSGSVSIEFTQSSITEVDYIGIGIHNGVSAGLSVLLEVQVLGVWQQVATLAPLGDNKTMIAYFDPLNSSRQRLTLNFTNKLFIGAIYIGKAWVFDKTPNLGFTPAHTNSLDKAEGFRSETNQFIMGRRVNLGFGTKGQFDFISWADDENGFEQQYVDYMNHIKDQKPVFMKWNKQLEQNFYGRHANPNSPQPPTYSNNTTGTFYFDYKGFA